MKKVATHIVMFIATLYCMTWRYKFKNKEIYDNVVKSGKTPVIALWHAHLLPCAFAHRNEGMVTIASDSKDGEIITNALNKWGFRTARGSSTRGGVKAALNAIKTAKKFKATCAITVDGPKGPRHKVKDGAVFIANQLDGIVIVGLANPKKFITFNSWDKFVLPLPFSSIEVYYSQILHMKNNLDEDKANLQQLMTELTNEICPSLI